MAAVSVKRSIKLKWIQQSLAEYKLAKTPNLFTVQFQELLRIVRIFWERYRFNSQEFFTFTCIHRLSTQNRIPPPLVFQSSFLVECSLGYKNSVYFSLSERNYECVRSHNNKTRGGLGQVCATGMYRSIEHVKFPKFQTGIFVEWKAPHISRIKSSFELLRASVWDLAHF